MNLFNNQVESVRQYLKNWILSDVSKREEVGASGIQFFNGLIKSEEFNSALTGASGAKTYDRMRRTDAQIAAILAVMGLPIRSANWEIETDNETDPDGEVKEFIEHVLFEKLNFEQLLYHLLLALPFGFEIMEKVWDIDSQGRMVLDKVAHRSQRTVYRWVTGDGDELVAIEQRVRKDGKYQSVKIPAEKLVVMTVNQEGANYEGMSVLRAAYKHWYIKDQIYRIDAIAHERFGIGVPKVTLPSNVKSGDQAKAEAIAKQYKAGEKSWVVVPYGWDISIMEANGRGYDPMPSIKHHDEMISRAVLAQFINFGTTESGARALAENMQDLYMFSLQAYARLIRRTINQQIIDQVMAFNYPDWERYKAKADFSGMDTRPPTEIANVLKNMTDADVIEPDEDLESWARDQIGAPKKMKKAEGETVEETPETPTEQPDEDDDPDQVKTSRGCDHDHSVKFINRDPVGVEKFVALREIEGRQDDAEEEVVRIFQETKDSWIDHLIESIRTGLSDGSAKELDKEVVVPASLRFEETAEFTRIQREQYRYGSAQVKEEKKRQERQSKRDKKANEAAYPGRAFVDRMTEQAWRDDPLDDSEVSDLFGVSSRKALDRLANRMESLATEQALSVWRTEGADFSDESIERIRETLEPMLDDAARKEGRGIIAAAFNLGRMSQAEKFKEEIREATYSAILDGALCEVCARFDGEVYRLGTAAYVADSPPNPQCLSLRGGVNYCRCIWVYTFRTEAA